LPVSHQDPLLPSPPSATSLEAMDPIHRLHRPTLRAPRALLAWEGWNDACDAASGAAAFLLDQWDDIEPFAVVEPEEFYDFQVRRPRVEVDEGGTRSLEWPTTRAYALDFGEAPHDALVVVGEEPSLRWKTYTRSIGQILAEADVDMIVTLGAFIGQVPHTIPVPIVGVATDSALVEEHGLMGSRYEGPTGIVGVMLEACREIGIPAISLWAATPHYLAANPNPRAMLALLDCAAGVMEIPFDTAELEKVAVDFDERVEAAMEANEEFVDYVRRLEEEADAEPGKPLDPQASDQMISEIEDFLGKR